MLHFTIKHVGIAAVLFCFAGSALAESLTNLEMLGRYVDLRRAVEVEMKDTPNQSTTQLAHLCVALSRLKTYQALYDCLGKLESRIQQGDVIQKADFIFIPEGDISALPYLLHSEILIDFGDYVGAIKHASAGLAKLPSGHLQLWGRSKFEIHFYSNLALASALSGDRIAALKHIDSLKNVSVPYIGSGTYNPIRNNGLGRAYMALGDYAKALEYIGTSPYEKAVVGLINLLSGLALQGDSIAAFTEIPRALMLAKCLKETGKMDKARNIMDNLLTERLLADQSDVQWLTLYERGRIAEAELQPVVALGFYLRAIEIIERQRSTINTEASKIGFVGDKQAVYARLITVLVAQGRAAEAFDYVERSKSRALVDMLASKKDFAAQDPAQARLVLAQLDAADLGARVQDESAKPDVQPAGSRNLQVARETLHSTMPELSALVTVTSVPSEELKSLVGTDETLIEYYYSGDDLIAFALSRAGLSVTKLDGTGLGSQVQALRAAIEQPGTTAWQAPSRALYEKLWKPLETGISTKNVIIVAHGALHYLPFSVLQAADDTLLIDRIDMRFLPSASVLKFLHPVSAKKDSQLLVLGNPDLSDTKLDLKFAESEARLIAGMSKTSRLLVRLDASETNFKKIAGVFSRLHFATHGKFQADDPLSSGLYLAKDAENDGVLTVGELYSMNLDADIVTLSACETGLGKVANGDDVVGLTRGFLYAGSRSIVASLWSVDDQATATLMKAFYENLSSQSKQEALRLAQLKTRETFPHPFYWAAFQLTGRAE